jgi:uncharacterized protein YPO0396
MKIRTLSRSAWALTFGALLAVSPLSLAADTSGAKTTAKDVSRKADDAARAVGKYTVQQRDEALKIAKSALDEADVRMRSLDRKLEREWDQMDQAARKKARAAQKALRKERDEAAEWYGRLKDASAESWEEVKSGFIKSYESLKDSIARVGKAL